MIFQLLIFATSIFVTPAYAQSSADGVLIRNAESMYSDTVKKTVKLEGNVHIVFHGQSLNCDRAVVDMANQTLQADGHVILESIKVHVEGTRLNFNYKQNTGIIYDGFVQSGQVIFEGEVIEKTGVDTYVAQNAEYTACETCPPGWAFSGRTIEAEIGGYAYIHRAIFKVGGVPIFIFPAIMVPLKSKRQTGFLVPGLEFSSLGGAAPTESFFWAIDRSHDATFTLTSYEKRGIKEYEEYRFVTSENGKGKMESAYINGDRALKNEYTIDHAPDRWFAHYQHYFELPENYVSRVDYKPVSDIRYVRDFPEELRGDGDPSLESKLSITKNSETQHLSAEGILNTNLLKYYPLSDNDDAVHRAPEIQYSSREQRIGENGPLLHWNLDYVNFARDKYAYDSVQLDTSNNNTFPYQQGIPINTNDSRFYQHSSVFNPNLSNSCSASNPCSVLRTGQRVDFEPTLSYPFQIAGLFDIMPSVSYRETQYRFDLPPGAQQFNYSPTAARRYVEADVDAKTEFSALYGDFSDEKGSRWKHSIVPEVSYSELPYIRYPNHPFFGQTRGLPYFKQWSPIGDADIFPGPNGLQFDYEDRAYDREVTAFTLTNKFTRKRWINGDPVYQKVALLQVTQSYDFRQNGSHFDPSGVPYNQPWSTLDGLLQVTLDQVQTYTTVSYNPYAHVAPVSTLMKFPVDLKNYLLLSYSHSYLFDVRNAIEPGSETEDYGAGLGFTSKYFDTGALVDFSPRFGTGTNHIQSFQGFLILRPPGNCWYIKGSLEQDLGGALNYHFNFAFDFSGGKENAAAAAAAQPKPNI